MTQEFGIDLLVFPVKWTTLRKECAKRDICPECGGNLDTGWECNDCGFDARDIAYPELQRYMDEKFK